MPCLHRGSRACLAAMLFGASACQTASFAPDGTASSGAGASGAGGAGGDYAPYEGVAFPDRRAPVSVPAGGLGIVTDSLSDRLSLVGLATGERTGVLPVGRDPVTVDGPLDLAVDVAGGSAFVLLAYPKAPSAAKGPHAEHTNFEVPGYVQKLALSDLSIVGEAQVDFEPRGIAVSQDGRRVVVVHPFESGLADAVTDPDPEHLDWYRGRLAVLDPSAIRPILSDEPLRVRPCLAPRSVVLSRPDGAFAYVACHGEDAVAVVGLGAQPPSIERILVGPDAGPPGSPVHGPSSLALSPDGATVAFANAVSHDLGFLTLASKTVVAVSLSSSAGRPAALVYSPDGAWLYVVTHEPEALLRLDAATGGELAGRVFNGEECAAPAAVAVAGGRLALVCSAGSEVSGKVLVLHASSLDTLASAETGLAPSSIAILPEETP
jgi:DNA-binding beta-propeller fold protein YncE